VFKKTDPSGMYTNSSSSFSPHASSSVVVLNSIDFI